MFTTIAIKKIGTLHLRRSLGMYTYSSIREPTYESNCPIKIDTFGNKMTYFGELKNLSHYIDTSNQIFAYHPKEHVMNMWHFGMKI